jgi:hypothetical protein
VPPRGTAYHFWLGQATSTPSVQHQLRIRHIDRRPVHHASACLKKANLPFWASDMFWISMLSTQRTSAQKRRSYSAGMFNIFDVLDALDAQFMGVFKVHENDCFESSA